MSLIISPFTLNIFEILFLTFASFILLTKCLHYGRCVVRAFGEVTALNQTIILAFVRSVQAFIFCGGGCML